MNSINEIVKRVWERLADEESKDIFNFRCMHFLTKDDAFLRKTALLVPEAKKVYTFLKRSTQKKLIFGAGIWGEGILRTFNDINFECFVDNYRDKKNLSKFAGKRVISFEEYLLQYTDDLIIISSRIYNRQIYQQLIENGISENNIVNIGGINDCLNKKQYFDLPQLKEHMCKNEIFVDAGSLDGRSSICFEEWCGGRYEKVYAIEPDAHNKELCRVNFKKNGIENYEIIDKGLWDKETILEFEENKNGVSKIVETGGNSTVQVDCLDHMIGEKERVTFIKMDIEGSEYNALLGCNRIVREQKPKLAICVYHKPEDIIEIPKLILSLNENYMFYIRHYSTIWGETVLYAL